MGKWLLWEVEKGPVTKLPVLARLTAPLFLLYWVECRPPEIHVHPEAPMRSSQTGSLQM